MTFASPSQPGSEASAGQDGGKHHKCKYCNATFHNENALKKHKIQQQREEDKRVDRHILHLYCQYCDCDTITEAAARHHWGQYHAEKQDINCPGCDKHFVHFSSFVHHIELHDCHVIKRDDAAARCQKELDFARALVQLDNIGRGINRQKDFSIYLDHGEDESVDHLHARLAIGDGSASKWPSDLEAEVLQMSDFPRLPQAEYRYGGTGAPDLLTGDENSHLDGKEGGNRWATAEHPFPNGPAAQRPTPEQMMQMQVLQYNEEREREEKAMTKARGVITSDPKDPSGPDFHPQNMYCQYTKSYKCPVGVCRTKKGFKSWPALEQHMLSAAHAFNKIVTCPNCMDNFTHLFALAAHVESADKKCQLKHSALFEIFLGQLTWNLIEVTGRNAEDKPKYDISKKAKEEYGAAKPAPQRLTWGAKNAELTGRSLAEHNKAQLPPAQPSPTSFDEYPSLPSRQHDKETSRSSGQPRSKQGTHPQPQAQSKQAQGQVKQPQAQLEESQFQTRAQKDQALDERRVAEGVAESMYQARYAKKLTQISQPPQLQQRLQPQQTRQWTQPLRQPRVRQQPSHSLGGGLTAAALAQVPDYPSGKSIKEEDDDAWSGDGDAGW